MATDDDACARTEFARWFLEHDEVEEAARVLEPGDELALGSSDSLALTAALSRRGLAAHYQLGRLSVLAPQALRTPASELLAGTARKPALRAPGVAATPATVGKRTA
jgi:hypothetical protein